MPDSPAQKYEVFIFYLNTGCTIYEEGRNENVGTNTKKDV